MNRILILFIVLSFSACTSLRNLELSGSTERGLMDFKKSLCSKDSIGTVLFKKVNTEFFYDNTKYSAKATILLNSDSALMFSIYSSGFEILRGGLSDSGFIFINRIDKIVIKGSIKELGISTIDVVSFFSNSFFCNSEIKIDNRDNYYCIDNSSDFVVKRYYYNENSFSLERAEIFNNRTNDYFLFERTQDGNGRLFFKLRFFEGNLAFTPVDPLNENSQNFDLNFSDKYEVIEW